MPVLDVRSLTVSYATGASRIRALRDVSFSISAGETLALVGESGSGKSTVSLAIIGLLAREATVHGGAMLFEGRDVRTMTPAQRQALRGGDIGVVFQDPFTSLNPSMRIGAQVAEPLVVHRRMSRAAALDKAIAALGEVGLPRPREVARAYPHQLSGGMQQRALIAAALICDPALVILDEPTTALDVTVEAEILDLLDDLRGRRRLAMLFITHNLGVVNRICDSVCVLYAGSVLEQGRTADVLSRPAHPYTRGLLGSMPTLDRLGRRARLASIMGKFPDLSALPSGCIFHPRCAHADARCSSGEPPLEPIDAARTARCWKIGSLVDLPARVATASSERASLASQPLLDLRDLRKTYSLGLRPQRTDVELKAIGVSVPWIALRTHEVRAVDGVSLSVRRGETLGLVGESGCGKSTLGRCTVRLIDATDGAIVFDGRDVSRDDGPRLRGFRGSAQIVFQNPVSSLNPRKTVGAAVGRSLANFSDAPATERRARVAQILEQVGLSSGYASRYPHQLSGGERQRVGIARALATGPRFVVCDEPVSALDVSVQATVLNLLADLRDRLGLAYLFISHDLSVVVHIADRIAVMYAGRICEEGPTDAVLAPPYHPYTETLLAAIPSADPLVARPVRARARIGASAMEPPSKGCCFQHRCPRKIGAICEDVAPPIVVAAPGHTIACHLPVTTLAAVAPVIPTFAAAAAAPAR